MKISYESTALIEEIKRDIAEFGKEYTVSIFFKMIENTKIITNYDFIVDEKPTKLSELQEGETWEKSTLGEVLIMLEEQNSII